MIIQVKDLKYKLQKLNDEDEIIIKENTIILPVEPREKKVEKKKVELEF